MTSPPTLALADTDAPDWPDALDRLRARLGAPHNPTLFPAHFLKATLPKIGGGVVTATRDGELVGAGFLFPRAIEAGRRVYTLRWHALPGAGDLAALADDTGRLLDGAEVVPYDPAAPQEYEDGAGIAINGVTLAAPNATEAAALPPLQAAIWGTAPDHLYPADLHSRGFAPGSTLVARQEGRVVGFLFGFAKFGGSPLPAPWEGRFGGAFRLESQLLGVVPEVRQLGLGHLLKRRQGELAREQGIGVVNWTVDPLQFGNAVLNFGRLRALAFDFYPDHYGFRNALNRVAASRFGITWLVGTARVREALAGDTRASYTDLGDHPAIPRANDGPGNPRLDLDAPMIAIEVPADWTATQRDDLDTAARWRATTDALFARYLGPAPGGYAVVGVGRDGARRYLLAERLDDPFLDRYGS